MARTYRVTPIVKIVNLKKPRWLLDETLDLL